MLEVRYQTKEELKKQYGGKLPSWAGEKNVLLVIHNGVLLFEEYDRGEPEDNSFHRDWAWVKLAIEKAYELGKLDGAKAP